jgi:hypothetical protein
MKLRILDFALESLELLRPVLLRIRREDPGLYRQLKEALNSVVLNLDSGGGPLVSGSPARKIAKST